MTIAAQSPEQQQTSVQIHEEDTQQQRVSWLKLHQFFFLARFNRRTSLSSLLLRFLRNRRSCKVVWMLRRLAAGASSAGGTVVAGSIVVAAIAPAGTSVGIVGASVGASGPFAT